MLKTWRAAIVSLAFLSLLTGVVYPVVVTVAAQLVFPYQARGSLIQRGSESLGSELIGQAFDDQKYFWGRPSATGPAGYNAMGGSGSNQAATNPALVAAVQERVAKLRAAAPDDRSPIPVDLVTASSSGLDPHVSPAAALYQVGRVAKARGLDRTKLEALVREQTEPPTLGFLGQSRVNVLRLNLALDALGAARS